MGRGGLGSSQMQEMPEYSWDEIQRHNLRTDRWIVVDDIVYDVTRFAKKHPGGEKIVSNWSGQNASVS
jgi:fatty acid desaturase 2 (delta-6 desaturase)